VSGGDEERPATCRVCGDDYASISYHESGLMINLDENERFRRVCVEPLPDERVRFYHHEHSETG